MKNIILNAVKISTGNSNAGRAGWCRIKGKICLTLLYA